jgi:hypothetical protein
MPRKSNSDVGISCNYCGEHTQSIEPIIIKRTDENRYYVKSKCIICEKMKNKFLNKKQIKLLPDDIRNIEIGKEVTNNIVKEGKLLPLIPLLGAIFAGVSALTGIGGLTASTVISAKKAAEDKRHNEQIEQIAQNVASGKGFDQLSDFDKYDTSVKYLQGHGFQIYV